MERPQVHGPIPYVFCADPGAVADWCRDVLGFEVRQRWTDDDGIVTNVELTTGGGEVWLDGPIPDWSERRGGLPDWVGFLVDDVDAWCDHLRAGGAEVDPPRHRAHGVRECGIADPEGRVWGFVERV